MSSPHRIDANGAAPPQAAPTQAAPQPIAANGAAPAQATPQPSAANGAAPGAPSEVASQRSAVNGAECRRKVARGEALSEARRATPGTEFKSPISTEGATEPPPSAANGAAPTQATPQRSPANGAAPAQATPQPSAVNGAERRRKVARGEALSEAKRATPGTEFKRPISTEGATETPPGWHAWLDTTGGVVFMLLVVQFLTGLLLAFYYVPSVDHAYTTVSFIEKVVSSGSWIRSLHHYGSQWLALFAFLHVIRLWWSEAYVFSRTHWLAAVLLLALVMAGAGTGYSLPWDARAFFSTRVAEGLMGGLPFAGRLARLWLLGGSDISTITLSRFFALHVLVTPFLILTVVAWRLLRRGACWPNVRRNVFMAGLVFLSLALWTLKFRAPLGPSASAAGADYLPRPGTQFLWLYQTLKHVPGGLGSVVGVVLPGIGLAILLLLPWLERVSLKTSDSRRVLGGLVLGVLTALVLTMTIAANLSDRRDPRTREQLAKQAAQETAWRNEPFSPVLIGPQVGAAQTGDTAGVPVIYVKFCANCHGAHGEGAQQGRLKFPPLLDVSTKPRRTVEDIAALLKDPAAYGLQPPMRSFSSKLTDQEMREIAEWVVRLKK